MFIQSNSNRGANDKGSVAIISDGSMIYVPENVVAVIISQGGIEETIDLPGGYEYRSNQETIFNGSSTKSIWKQTKTRLGYGGQSPDNKQIIFVNMREIRGIKFGTRGPQTYNDLFYGTDLEILAFGTFSIRISDPIKLIQTFVPANVNYYSLDDEQARNQLLSEFIQSFSIVLNSLSGTYRISQLPAQSGKIVSKIIDNQSFAGDWENRFGFAIQSIGIENIEFSPDSKELVKQYSSNRMNVKAYEGISKMSSNIAAQQKIAQGIQEHGLGDGMGALLGINLSHDLENDINTNIDEKIEILTKLKKLVDLKIISEDEFTQKKKEILNIAGEMNE